MPTLGPFRKRDVEGGVGKMNEDSHSADDEEQELVGEIRRGIQWPHHTIEEREEVCIYHPISYGPFLQYRIHECVPAWKRHMDGHHLGKNMKMFSTSTWVQHLSKGPHDS